MGRASAWLNAGEGAALRNAGSGEEAETSEVLVDGAGGAATLIDGPHDKGLTTPTVTGSEDTFHIGGEFAMRTSKSLPVAARVLALDAEHLADFKFRADKAGGEQHEIGGPFLFGALHFTERGAAFDRFGPVNFHGSFGGGCVKSGSGSTSK